MEINKKKLYFNAALSSSVTIPLSLLISIMTANSLSTENRGLLQLYITVGMVIGTIASLGIPFANSYLESKKKPILPDKIFLIFIAIFSYSSTLVYQINEKNLLPQIFYSISFTFFYYFLERHKSISNHSIYTRTLISQTILNFFLISVCYFFSFDVEEFVYAYAISFLIILKFTNIKKIFSINSSINTEGIKYAFHHWLNLLLSLVTNNIEKVLLIKFLSLSDLGIYSVLISLTSIISKVSERLSVTFFGISSHSGPQKINKRYILLMISIGVPIYFLGGVIGQNIIPLLFSDKYTGQSYLMSLIASSTYYSHVGWFIAQKTNADGKPILNFIRNAIGLCFFLVYIYYNKDNITLGIICEAVLISAVIRFIASILYLINYD